MDGHTLLQRCEYAKKNRVADRRKDRQTDPHKEMLGCIKRKNERKKISKKLKEIKIN